MSKYLLGDDDFSAAGPYFCGIDAAMDVVAGKWKSLILWERKGRIADTGLPVITERRNS